jgi:hypothetical protein
VNRYEFRYDRWCGWLLGLMGHGRRLSRIQVDDRGIQVCMGLGFRTNIPHASVVSVVDVGHRRVLGWGVHGWRGRWLVNGSSSGLVTIGLEPPVRAKVLGFPVRLRELTVSVVEPAALVADLGAR